MRWHIITGEYPPQEGGVSDYTRQVAEALAAQGDDVHAWAPPCAGASDGGDVHVHRLPDRFGLRSLRHLTRTLDAERAPRRVLVQYVPHAFGHKGANVAFAAWVRSRAHDSVWTMFHEVAYPFERGDTLSRNALAAVNRMMASLVASAARRVFVSIPGWEAQVRPLVTPGTPIEWLPVPSAIPVVADPAGIAAARARYARDGAALVGHVGTYGSLIQPLLEPALIALLESTACHVLLIGRRSDTAARELIERHPACAPRVHPTGALSRDDLSRCVSACDVMLQPYPDGLSTRRTSAMVALSHGRPLVSTTGRLTEPLWAQSSAVVLAPAGDARELAGLAAALLRDPAGRQALAAAAAGLYDRRFDVRHTIAALHAPAAAVA